MLDVTFARPIDFDPLAFVQDALAVAPNAWHVEALLQTSLEEVREVVPPHEATLEAIDDGVVIRLNVECLDEAARYLIRLGWPFWSGSRTSCGPCCAGWPPTSRSRRSRSGRSERCLLRSPRVDHAPAQARFVPAPRGEAGDERLTLPSRGSWAATHALDLRSHVYRLDGGEGHLLRSQAPTPTLSGNGDMTVSGSRPCSRSSPSLARRSRSLVSETAVASRWVPLG